MKFDKPSASKAIGGPQTGITGENYFARAQAFVASKGEGFVIRALEGPEGSLAKEMNATEPQWVAWLAYFDEKGVKTRFLRSRGMGTVPCEWPEDFDLECKVSDRMARLPRNSRFEGEIPKVRWQSLTEAIKTVHRPDWKPETENVDDLAERYQRQAAQLSPELRAKLVPGSQFQGESS